MYYVSTRGEAPRLDFADVLLTGLAPDGGLYVPETYPLLAPEEISDLATRPYSHAAERVIGPFVGNAIAAADLRAMIDGAYATFAHKAISPLVQIGPNKWVLELFHGTTLAFKDVAMQFLARAMDHVLAERGRRATIVGATSGDTGGAAIDAFRHCERVDVFILFPDGRVSDVQRRQMTTVGGANVHALAIDGTFDDCQAIVKSMFVNPGFRDAVGLSGVNSINWARIVAQIVYYVTSAAALGSPERAVSYCVPTGNFGDILAGYVAKNMGVPIDRLVVATNVNDILARALDTGGYETDQVVPTITPSMDIQVSSNFERLLFDANGRNPEPIRNMMARLKQSGAFAIAAEPLSRIRSDFDAGRADEEETSQTMQRTLSETGYLLDPHTAVGIAVANRMESTSPMVTLATAHPAKFPAAVESACGIVPDLPERVGDLFGREERMTHLPADQAIVEAHVLATSRAGGGDARAAS
ncbi:MAG: threonine synthase [Pseudomonadota bacterium]